MNREYAIFYSRRYPNPSVLDISSDNGVTFCAKEHDPFRQCGVYKIVHSGLDKHRKPYRIAEPVFELSVKYYDVIQLAEDVVCRNNRQHLVCGEHYNKQRVQEHRLNKHFGRDAYTLIDIDWLTGLFKTYPLEEIHNIINKADISDDMDFELKTVTPNVKYRPGDSILVYYLNGESEWKTAAWIYKNNDRLLNCEIIVRGHNADTLVLEFHRV